MLTAYQARYVFPIGGPPIEDGVVVVEDGCVREVGCNVPTGAAVVNLNERNDQTSGGVAVLPGLVNAHTHLEFSDLHQPLGEAGMAFADWIRDVIAHRLSYSPTPAEAASRRAAAIAKGLHESHRAGSTTIGDIAPFNPLDIDYDQTPACCIIFREWKGLRDEQVDAAVGEAQCLMADWAASESPPWTPGFSPHAPYSTHFRIVEELCRLAQPMTPVAMHLAESLEELELLATHAGPFRQLLDELGVWNAGGVPRGSRPMDYLQWLAAAPRAMVIHGNYLDAEEIAYLAERADRISVVYCPRTHAYFQHKAYPLAEMLAAGVNVALGTDSRASSADLSLLAEMRHVARHHPSVSPEAILQMGTLNGARPLGLADRIGSLESGKTADMAVVSLPDASDDDPHALLLQSDLPNVATICHGSVTK